MTIPDFTLPDDDLLDEKQSMAHPLVSMLAKEAIAPQPDFYEGNRAFFTGLRFRRKSMEFLIAICRDGRVLLRTLERIGPPQGILSTWFHLYWFVDLLKAHPETGCTAVIGKIKPFGPNATTPQRLRQFYVDFCGSAPLGMERGCEWLMLPLAKHIPRSHLKLKDRPPK